MCKALRGGEFTQHHEKETSLQPWGDGFAVICDRHGLAIFRCKDENERNDIYIRIRDNHMALRRNYRESEEVEKLAEAMHGLDLQRENILLSLRQLAGILEPS